MTVPHFVVDRRQISRSGDARAAHVGFAQGLAAWHRFLKPGGHLVVSEFCWLQDDPAAELREFLADGCSDVGDVAARRQAIAANGYDLVGDFVLPAVGWFLAGIPRSACR